MDARPSKTPQHADTIATTPTAESIGAKFDANLKADEAMAWPLPDGHDGYVKLPLRKLGEPSHRVCPEIYRTMNLVDKRLRDVFRELVTGNLPWPLFLWGPAGTGKTRAALSLCDFVEGAKYGTVQECCDNRMNRRLLPWEAVRGLIDEDEPPLFVLDELGTRMKVGDLEYGIVTECFESRERHGKGVAVYVSNLDPPDIQNVYDDRIASRVLSGSVFNLDGVDRREK